ncbi:MAG: hypothetical protein FRX49_03211 [Trebouxia sp. A1-2]|nr:MAG: hypothetical protein FRX49_03211 [Trebouxia sp. A1-2]
MHSYKTLLAGDILHLPLTRSVSINKRPPKKAQGHVTLRPRSQGIEAYATDRTAGVSPHLLGISHSLQDILKPSINVVQVRRQPPADIIGLADLLRDIPSFKAQLRCLCTYIGEGTYFVPNKAVNRHNWIRALGICDTNGFGVKSATSVQQATEWDVVILKGEAFPGNQGPSAWRVVGRATVMGVRGVAPLADPKAG